MNRTLFSLKTLPVAKVVTIGLLTLVASSVKAQTVSFTLTGVSSNSQQVNISTNSGSNYNNVSTGPYVGTYGSTSNVNIYCVDASHNITIPGTYTANIGQRVTAAAGTLAAGGNGYYSGGLASAITNTGDYGISITPTPAQAAARSGKVAYLATQYLNATTSAAFAGSGDISVKNNQTAISVAIWDLVQDGGDGIGTGSFRATTSLATLTTGSLSTLVNYYEAQAAAYLAANPSFTGANVYWTQGLRTNGAHAQDFLFLSSSNINPIPTAAVPEPSAIVTGIAMLGITGLGMVRGRRRNAKG